MDALADSIARIIAEDHSAMDAQLVGAGLTIED